MHSGIRPLASRLPCKPRKKPQAAYKRLRTCGKGETHGIALTRRFRNSCRSANCVPPAHNPSAGGSSPPRPTRETAGQRPVRAATVTTRMKCAPRWPRIGHAIVRRPYPDPHPPRDMSYVGGCASGRPRPNDAGCMVQGQRGQHDPDRGASLRYAPAPSLGQTPRRSQGVPRLGLDGPWARPRLGAGHLIQGCRPAPVSPGRRSVPHRPLRVRPRRAHPRSASSARSLP